jgi:hypothetical protein
MEHIKEMQTVVETPGYLKAAKSLFSQTERDRIVALVAANPECGEVMQGTGGLPQAARCSQRYGKAWRGALDLHTSQ